MQAEKQRGYNLQKIELSELPQFLKSDSPMLIRELERRYPYEGVKPSKKLSKFEDLERKEQMRVLGWIYGASLRLARENNFYTAMKFITLSTLRTLERTSDYECQNSSIQENMAYERGYTYANKKD